MISHDPMYPVPPVTHTAPLFPSISLSLSLKKITSLLWYDMNQSNDFIKINLTIKKEDFFFFKVL